MRRYFFDMLDGGKVVPDEEGMNLSSLDAVQDEAAYALADMARDQVRASAKVKELGLAYALNIVDGNCSLQR
jgi:hypothetical protein